MAKEYYVNKGKSVITKIGMKNAGEKITAGMFTGGEEALEKLVESKKEILTTEKILSPEAEKEKRIKDKIEKEKAELDSGANRNVPTKKELYKAKNNFEKKLKVCKEDFGKAIKDSQEEIEISKEIGEILEAIEKIEEELEK